MRLAIALLVPALLAVPRLAVADDAYSYEPYRGEREVASGAHSGFSGALEAGPGYRWLDRHNVFGIGAGLGLGGHVEQLGAVHGRFGLFRGASDGLLGVLHGQFGASWEFILGRFRAGLGAQLDYLVVDRATRDDSIDTWGGSGSTHFDIDVVQSGIADFYAGASLHVGAVSADPAVALVSASLDLGARLEYP